MFRKLLSKPWISPSALVLTLRLLLGVVFFAHGGQKVLGWFGGDGLAATVGHFQSNLGIPPFLGYVAAFTEFLGGIFLIVGFLTRAASIGLVVTMIVAIVTVHLSKGFFGPEGFEYPLSLLVAALGIFLYGPGKYSIDSAISGTPTVTELPFQEKHAA